MTSKEFLKLHFPQSDDLVNGNFRELFERKLEEFAQIKTAESLNEVVVYIEEFTPKNKTTQGVWSKVKNLIKQKDE